MNLISLSIKKPAAVSKWLATPTLDAWERWAVPKASLTKRSPKLAQYLPNSGSFLDSFLPSTSSKRVFSNTKTSPSAKPSIAASKAAPRVSGTKVTSLPNNSPKRFATGAKDLEALSSSVLTLPKWEKRMSFALLSIKYWIVGKAWTIRLSSVMTPSFIGTLKSTRTNTFLPATSKSVTIFFAI